MSPIKKNKKGILHTIYRSQSDHPLEALISYSHRFRIEGDYSFTAKWSSSFSLTHLVDTQ